ncbi:hypothetical protein DFH09DRAFT_1277345 [Mycena vulgaris]|nr:hypothetical protein DFH09DRAFT_1277345 [Mycena vulgaris]
MEPFLLGSSRLRHHRIDDAARPGTPANPQGFVHVGLAVLARAPCERRDDYGQVGPHPDIGLRARPRLLLLQPGYKVRSSCGAGQFTGARAHSAHKAARTVGPCRPRVPQLHGSLSSPAHLEKVFTASAPRCARATDRAVFIWATYDTMGYSPTITTFAAPFAGANLMLVMACTVCRAVWAPSRSDEYEGGCAHPACFANEGGASRGNAASRSRSSGAGLPGGAHMLRNCDGAGGAGVWAEHLANASNVARPVYSLASWWGMLRSFVGVCARDLSLNLLNFGEKFKKEELTALRHPNLNLRDIGEKFKKEARVLLGVCIFIEVTTWTQCPTWKVLSMAGVIAAEHRGSNRMAMVTGMGREKSRAASPWTRSAMRTQWPKAQVNHNYSVEGTELTHSYEGKKPDMP